MFSRFDSLSTMKYTAMKYSSAGSVAAIISWV